MRLCVAEPAGSDDDVLPTKTKFYHWNVRRPKFHDIHELLDEQNEILAEMVDELAEENERSAARRRERARFKAHTRLGEDEGDSIPDTWKMSRKQLPKTTMSPSWRRYTPTSATEDKHNDAYTSNLLQDISDKHHKMAWMLRMILQQSTLD